MFFKKLNLMAAIKLLCSCIILFAAVGAEAKSPINTTQSSSTGAKGALTVVVTGFKTNDGTLEVFVYNSEAAYKKHDDTHFRTGSANIKNGRAVCVIKDLPYGDYAVLLLHDTDGNKKATYFLGIPTEGYGGVGSNARFSLPPFNQVKFNFDQPAKTVYGTVSK